ncbi:putative oxidoreductase [Gordonia hirsuta DSM 44140 = NBRC 16056]|uniref:Putative oxidoreductase n=1 Tax=Gordonia hirsuta DSM 44140 = NBRC 16056 TaxID=1121927 RepID=L7LFB9_9ACTN|nr:flavin reductase family protein [Gordonia hirsuta]GAC58777.1 putative oxidoreductase [Gordonia hirsuta DSM 44140 = NBRC 16056]
MIDGSTPLDPAGDARALKRAYSCFPSGVVAVCRSTPTVGDGSGGELIGMSASAFSTVSLDPPLVSVSVRRESATWPLLRDAQALGVSVFAAHQGQVCRQLAGPPAERFSGVEPLVHDSGAVFVPDAAAHLVCTVFEEVPAGDHTIVLLRIDALRSDPGVDPLVFHASTFRALEARRTADG